MATTTPIIVKKSVGFAAATAATATLTASAKGADAMAGGALIGHRKTHVELATQRRRPRRPPPPPPPEETSQKEHRD